MAQPIDDELREVLISETFRPAITTWNRLEGRPRREDFDRSLRAEIRDPLWMVSRQWQFGEFKGEDAGSAIKAKVQLNTALLNRYAAGGGEAVGYLDELPLEAKVEREPVHFDLHTRAQIGVHWFRLLAEVGDFETLYLGEFGFTDPAPDSEEEAQLRSDRVAWQTFEALKNRAVDGEKLLRAIRSETGDHATWLESVVPDPAIRASILERARALSEWFDRVYSQPSEIDDPAWADSYLEYQFACAAPADETGERQTVLVAEQYHHGRLDWYSFDLETDPEFALADKPGASIPDARLVSEDPISFIPNPIEFGGMPNVRWWEFEDRHIDFGDIRPSTSDLATLLLAEFGLIYGNDWSLVPYVVKVGTLCEVQGVVITDGFGVKTLIRPAVETVGGDLRRWGMYYLNATQGEAIDTRLFLPPAVGKLEESSPLERVVLARDEMANMVWGIEDVIPSVANGGTKGHEAANDLESYFLARSSPPPTTPPAETEAQIQYKLGTTVPENWIPFIPIHNPGSNRETRLQRAAMPRLIPGIPEVPVEPRGAVLRPGLDEDQPYFVHEEEVLRAGALITRTYQRTRWWDGRVYTWLGRRKRTGRGQGSSGLEFDRIVPAEK